MQAATELSSSPLDPARRSPAAVPPDIDQRVILRCMMWKDYELMLTIRGESSGVRMAYLNGEVELMSPCFEHWGTRATIARLLEAYVDERGIDINGYGSWTLKNASKEASLEPDECYVLGGAPKDVPDLAVEVVWTSGGLNKFEIYRALGVGEVWLWERGAGITVHVLRDGAYHPAPKSALLPDLDLALLQRFIHGPSQSQSVRAFRAALRDAAK